ncbi:alpha/beta-hydrolase [Penicillium longicatenatum]|uniref:alpha/beta-hydrolase n=1 Tax=Penicillium longicatenatum TaxID=1561947 RepID=UPI00254714EE|nr:alpha/beta-hydrolase [Penicillium longicatenatum]KAJ5635583.1 alpha/beta-hydrolase [Penicillium longicatenatum]
MGNTLSAYGQTSHEVDLGPKGKIQGIQYDNKARRYAGIPYALPPVGPHRWRKPRPLPAAYSYSQPDGTAFDGSTFRPVCPQEAFAGGAEKDIGPDTYSEDCLLLNIWTPVEDPENPDKKWPVVLWLHGGWFQLGEPLQEVGMDPTEMISTGKLNAIVIGIGYRLNIFGFLAGEALLEDSHGESAGNFGLWDQRLAMEWIYENIAAFNGDVNNITLGGRSAGAYGVHAQVLHEFQVGSQRQLFHRFYMYSNAIPAQPKALADVNPQFEELCGYFNVPTDLSGPQKVDKLREIGHEDLVAAIKHLKNHTFRPVTDELFVFPGFTEYHRSGAFAEQFRKRRLRVLIGEVLNEETLYATYNSPEPNLDSLRLQLSNYYAPGTTDRILKSYTLPSTTDAEEWKNVYGNIIADGQVRAPSRWLVNSLFSHGIPLRDIWRYRIAYRLSFITDKVAPRAFGVSHAMDKPFWNFSILHGPTNEERELMEGWIQSFVAFVNDDSEYDFGTNEIDEMKVATSGGKIEIQEDQRWGELVKLGEIFASDA